MAKMSVVNVVATANLGQTIELQKLDGFPEITHNPKIYGGRAAYFRSSKIKGEVTIFSSGKMISAGTITEEKAFENLLMAANFLVEIGVARKTKLRPETQNIVTVVTFEDCVNLEKFSETQRVIYEPEQFPGAILRLEEPYKASVLLFASGKAVITGLKCGGQIEPTICLLKKIIDSNR